MATATQFFLLTQTHIRLFLFNPLSQICRGFVLSDAQMKRKDYELKDFLFSNKTAGLYVRRSKVKGHNLGLNIITHTYRLSCQVNEKQ